MKNSEYDAWLSEVSGRLDRLKAKYEQYFQGIERTPPGDERDKLARVVRDLRRAQPNNTALKFRYQTLKQRWVTLGTYWDRITRQIEEGTYYRDVQRARRRKKKQEERTQIAEAKQAFELDLEGSVDLDAEVALAIDAIAGRKSKAPATATAVFSRPRRSTAPPEERRKRRPPAVPAAARGRPSGPLDENRMRKIYDAYVAARRRNNESVDNLRFETMERRLKKMVPKLQQKHGKANIDFKIVLKNGKVGLKPVTSD